MIGRSAFSASQPKRALPVPSEAATGLAGAVASRAKFERQIGELRCRHGLQRARYHGHHGEYQARHPPGELACRTGRAPLRRVCCVSRPGGLVRCKCWPGVSVEAILQDLDADPKRVRRLTGWCWITDALHTLPRKTAT